jgi:hypothetical protein
MVAKPVFVDGTDVLVVGVVVGTAAGWLTVPPPPKKREIPPKTTNTAAATATATPAPDSESVGLPTVGCEVLAALARASASARRPDRTRSSICVNGCLLDLIRGGTTPDGCGS